MAKQTKEERKRYREEKVLKGYIRVNKWCPQEYRKSVNALIDILSCHKEDVVSTSDFHDFLSQFMSMMQKYHNEYEVRNEHKVYLKEIG